MIVDSEGKSINPDKTLETLSVIERLATSSYTWHLCRDTTYRQSLARSLGQIIVSKQASQEMEESIATLKKSGVRIEIF